MAQAPITAAQKAALAAAYAGGATDREAAEAAGVGERTAKRYKPRPGGTAGPPQGKAAGVAHRPAKPAKAPTHAPAPPEEPAIPDADLLATLRAELAHAMRKRKAATTDAAGEKWSKRVQALADAVGRLQPPPPPPPDAIREELRRLDGEFVRRVEALLADPIDPKEIAA